MQTILGPTRVRAGPRECREKTWPCHTVRSPSMHTSSLGERLRPGNGCNVRFSASSRRWYSVGMTDLGPSRDLQVVRVAVWTRLLANQRYGLHFSGPRQVHWRGRAKRRQQSCRYAGYKSASRMRERALFGQDIRSCQRGHGDIGTLASSADLFLVFKECSTSPRGLPPRSMSGHV